MFTKLKLQELFSPGDEVRIWTYSNKVMDGVVMSIDNELLTLHSEREGITFEMYIDIDDIEIPQKIVKYEIPKGGVDEDKKKD